MLNSTFGTIHTGNVSKPQMSAAALPLAGFFKVLKEMAMATPLALMIQGLRNRG